MRLIKKIALIAFIAMALLPLTGLKETRAEGETVTYVFSGLAIPEGQSDIFPVDAATIELFRQNPAVINVFVSALAERYNTPVAVIDQMSEVNYLLGVVNGTAAPGNHIPAYVAVAPAAPAVPQFVPQSVPQAAEVPAPQPAPGTSGVISTPVNMDINNGNYIDINITTQTLTLYQNGAATYAVPVVTGNVRAGHNTPQGLFAVQYKQLDRTLKGEDYESFVHYWMRIVNNVGIHDANWRSDFGGSIYQKNGSHGCINVPPSLMPPLYEAVPVGTPVWVHS
ncbi:MAG: L,D-transpeptidase [Lachnospiraceae bacterium]|nr:L,D-transpeptidase [Lachnospiraceae bacterium]